MAESRAQKTLERIRRGRSTGLLRNLSDARLDDLEAFWIAELEKERRCRPHPTYKVVY